MEASNTILIKERGIVEKHLMLHSYCDLFIYPSIYWFMRAMLGLNLGQALYHLRLALQIERCIVMCFSKKKLNLFTPYKKRLSSNGREKMSFWLQLIKRCILGADFQLRIFK